ncbi:hypothetical protein [Janibacter terrae]|uniref:hypothetical protein n=1 Tax=Janibacter terrae TaxID=103817 RepID=UPI000837B568|nr:hypothetical protein [Janibacter terrae]
MAPTRPRHVDISAFQDLALFSTAQAHDAAISGHDLAALVRRELIWRPAPGWYSCRPDATDEERHVLRVAANLRLLGDGAAACRVSAVLLHGMPIARCDLATVEIAVLGAGHGRTRRSVRVSEFAAKGADCRLIDVPLVGGRVRVVDPATAIVGMAAANSPSGALVAADHAVRHGLCTVADLEEGLRVRSGTRGVAAARRALAHVDPRYESPGETLTAAVLRLGAWEYDPQVWVRAGGRWYRLDFAVRGLKVAIEFDGEVKYTGPEVMQAQLARQAALEAEGWVFVRIGWADLDDPAILLGRVRDAVAVAGPA